MSDHAAINRSVNSIKNELEYLRDSKLLSPEQFQSITQQLPYEGHQSQYVDPRFANGGNDINPAAIAQQSQDPNHPAHPQNPKHHEWVSKIGSKLGNAAIFGAGATMGSDLVNSALHAL